MKDIDWSGFSLLVELWASVTPSTASSLSCSVGAPPLVCLLTRSAPKSGPHFGLFLFSAQWNIHGFIHSFMDSFMAPPTVCRLSCDSGREEDAVPLPVSLCRLKTSKYVRCRSESQWKQESDRSISLTSDHRSTAEHSRRISNDSPPVCVCARVCAWLMLASWSTLASSRERCLSRFAQFSRSDLLRQIEGTWSCLC